VRSRQKLDVNNALQLKEHWDKYAEIALHFENVATLAKNHVLIGSLGEYDAQQFEQWILLLESIIDALHISLQRGIPNTPEERIRQCYHQQRCMQVGVWTHAALSVYVADIGALRLFTRTILGDEEQWPVLSKALLENALHGWNDWRNADNPKAEIARIARRIARKEKKADAPSEEKTFLSFDESFDIAPEDIADAPVQTFSLSAVLADDPDLLAYAKARQTAKHAAACKLLGWPNGSRAKAVQQRYLGWKRWLKDPPSGTSDASRTTEYEILEKGQRGSAPPSLRGGNRRSGGGRGVWQHREPKEPKQNL
jgi:hypothetical protein